MVLVPYPCDLVKVQTHHVLFSGEAVPDLANAYRSATGGVVLPVHPGIQFT
jgi:hypothetical protein